MIKTIDALLAKFYYLSFSYPKTLLIFCIISSIGIFVSYIRNKKIVKINSDIKEQNNVLSSALNFHPDGFYLWNYSKAGFIDSGYASHQLAVKLNLEQGYQASFEEVCSCFDQDNDFLLNQSIQKMRQTGENFQIILKTKTDLYFAINGYRSVTLSEKPICDILVFHDVTKYHNNVTELTSSLNSTSYQQEIFKQIFDSLPFPVWIRNEQLELDLVNKAYLKASGKTETHEVIEEGYELILGSRDAKVLASTARSSAKENSSRPYLINISDKRKWYEASELPLKQRRTYGFAKDVTCEHDLEESKDAYNSLAEHVNYGIAIFSSDQKLKFYNTKFLEIWDLEAEKIDASPSFSQLLEILREQRKLPETRDYFEFKKNELALFDNVLSQKQDIFSLPKGIVLQRTIIRQSSDKLMFMFEDITSSENKNVTLSLLKETQKQLIKTLNEPVLLLDSENRVLLTNNAFNELWELSQSDIATLPTMPLNELIDLTKDFFDESLWESVKSLIYTNITMQKNEVLELQTGNRIIEFSSHSLPDNSTLVIYKI